MQRTCREILEVRLENLKLELREMNTQHKILVAVYNAKKEAYNEQISAIESILESTRNEKECDVIKEGA